MSSTAIDGLVSGLDTTSLINQLMTLESQPQSRLKTKQSSAETMVSALQSLNTKVASLATNATAAAKASSWSAFAATSSAESVTATVGTTATGGTVSFRVNAVAGSQISLSNATPDNGSLVSGLPPALTVKKADGTFVTVEPASGSLADVTSAVNKAADLGLRATVVRVADSAGAAAYRIQFTGTTTGTAGAFEVYAGTQAQVEAGTATRIDANVSRAATDASLTLWPDTATATTLTQSSNTFAGLMTGVDVTVSSVTAPDDSPVTVEVTQDSKALTSLATNLVAGLNTVLAEITTRTKSTTSTDPDDGGTVVKGGLFSGDATVRALRQSLLSVASNGVNGRSMSDVGISFDRNGTFTLDAKAFAAALAADPSKVQDLVSGFATQLGTVATAASNASTGTLTQKVSGQQSLVRDLGSQIDNWDVRLELRRTSLEKTYSSLEVALQKLQSQSSWLSSQLESLTASASS